MYASNWAKNLYTQIKQLQNMDNISKNFCIKYWLQIVFSILIL